MLLKYFLSIIVLLTITKFAEAQKKKVIPKGMPPRIIKKTAATKSKYSLEQFNGKWQEVKRTGKRSNSSLAFKDTLFYNFLGNGEVYSRDGVNMSMKGEAAIEPDNVLVAAADVFTIRSMNNNQLVLDDGEYIHTLERRKNFWYETLPATAVNQEKFITPVKINASALAGEWRVYRREAKPGTAETVLLRFLNIQNIKDDKNATGKVTFYTTGKTETLHATFMLDGENLQISTEKNTWNMMVYQADDNDLVFGDASLRYYCKPL